MVFVRRMAVSRVDHANPCRNVRGRRTHPSFDSMKAFTKTPRSSNPQSPHTQKHPRSLGLVWRAPQHPRSTGQALLRPWQANLLGVQCKYPRELVSLLQTPLSSRRFLRAGLRWSLPQCFEVLKPPLLPRLAAAEAHLRPARLRAERVLHRKVSPVQVQRIGDPQAGAPLVAALLLVVVVVAWLLSACCCCCCCCDALVLLRQFYWKFSLWASRALWSVRSGERKAAVTKSYPQYTSCTRPRSFAPRHAKLHRGRADALSA